MSRIKKKYIIIVLVLVVLVLLLVATNKREDQTSIRSTTPSTTIISGSVVRFSEDLAFNVPEEIGIYSIEKAPFTSEYISDIRSKLGISSTSFEARDAIFGRTIIFSDQNGYLRIVPDKRIVDFKNGRSFDLDRRFDVSDDEIESVSRQILQQTFRELNVDFLKLRSIRRFFLTEEGIESNSPTTNTIVSTFDFVLEDFPIISTAFEIGTATLFFDNQLNVTSLKTDEPNNINKVRSARSRTLEQIKENLDDIELQSLDQGKIDVTKINRSYVHTATIERIELAYLQTLRSNTLEPVLMLSGIANTNEGVFEVTYTLSAVEN